MGSTKVFLRQSAFDALEKLRTNQLSSAATRIQCIVRMFLSKKIYSYLRSSIIIIQKTYRMIMGKRIVMLLRRERACVKIQSVWRCYLRFSDFSTILYAVLWVQRTFRGRRIRQLYRVIRQESKAIKIQSWWRLSFSRKNFVLKRRVAFNIQQLFRCKKSKRILKELRIESRSLSKIAKERDEFKKELLSMRQELEAAKAIAMEATISNATCNLNKAEGRPALGPLQKVFLSETASVVSSVCNDSLVNEMVRKDKEIEFLRREIEFLKQSTRFRDRVLLMNASTTEISTTELSLLDSENPDQQRINFRPRELPHSLHELERPDEYAMSDISVSFENHIHLAVHASDEDALSVAVSCADDLICEINQGGLGGRTPLHIAVLNSKLSIVELLLEKECITNAQDDFGNTPLHYAKSELFVRVLLEKGQGNPNIPNNDGWCPLHSAVQRLDAESCRTLLSHGSKVNAADHDRWLTPLHVLIQSLADTVSPDYDCSSKVVEIAKLLCKQESVAVDEQDKDGNTALHYASTLNHNGLGDIITLFLQCGANPNIVNSRGQTPLHLLLHNRHASSFPFYRDLVLLLLRHEADVNIQTNSGCTPLHLAVYHGDMQIAALLLSEANGQLHIPWRKPESWKSHWDSSGSSETYCLDMTREVELLIHAVRCKQIFAPLRSCCMHCKTEFHGLLRRQVNCENCGSAVCSSCLYGKIDSSQFPRYCECDSTSKHFVCKICKDLFMTANVESNL